MTPDTATPWEHDLLNRKADGEHLIEVLLGRYEARKATGTGSYILNIDASWGEGKTFFLDNLALDLRQRSHIVATVNAWKDDHADDPLITVMSAIEDALARFIDRDDRVREAFGKAKAALGPVAAEVGKQVLFHALKVATGVSVGKVIEVATTNETLDDKAFDKSAEKVWEKTLETLVGDRAKEHKRANAGIVTFRQQTAVAIKYAVEKCKIAPMFVFVDELDRCRPTYAIRLLEDCKHLFDIEGLVFVIATDSAQLAHSIKAVYGAEFEARKYLRRFFDRVFVFPEVDRMKFLTHTFEQAGIDLTTTFWNLGEVEPKQHLRNWANGLKFTNRDIVQMVEIISTFVTSWEHPCLIELNFLLALVTTFYVSDDETFRCLELQSGVLKNKFPNWMIQHRSYEHGQTISGQTGAEHAFFGLFPNLGMSLPQISDSPGPFLYKTYFQHERATRSPGGYGNGAVQKSALNEYASRVRNAGRVIDRKSPVDIGQ